MASEQLDETNVGAYAICRGVIFDGPCRATVMSGGISSTVLLVESRRKRVVVKQALPRLRVVDEWFADPSRAQAEAAALRVLHSITPKSVPELLDDDSGRHAITISAAPRAWRNWKPQLLGGIVRTDVAYRLGLLLSRWHAATEQAQLPEQLEGLALFEQLRLTPYFGTTATRQPELRNDLNKLVVDIRSRQRCLVLGDFSPKNVLVGSHGLWVIDLVSRAGSSL